MRTAIKRLGLIAIVALTLIPLWSAGGDLRPFDTTSYASIVQAHRDQPFILGFWSLDCPPCLRELEGLGRWTAEHPEAVLVLVATDEGMSVESLDVLRRFGLETAENWAMAQPFDTRLRFTIDPLWYGELPRSYLFDDDNSREAISGVLEEQRLSQWWGRNGRLSSSSGD